MSLFPDVYQSRTAQTPGIHARQDPVIYSEGEPAAGLTKEQAAYYAENGFVFLEGLFSNEEVYAFTKELQALSADPRIKEAPEAILERDTDNVRSVFRVHALSEMFSRLCRDPRLLEVARYLLGDDVYIHQSRINMKPGFAGKEFYWHSDFETWHEEDGMPRMRAVSCSILLTENNEFNGPLMLIPGSHNFFISCVGKTPEDNYKSSLKRQLTGVPDESSLTFLADHGGLVAPKGKPGSVLFFECNTMHGSGSNISPFPRSNVFFVYNSMVNRVVEPFCGNKPRPEYIATRNPEALTPAATDYISMVDE